MLYMFQIDKKRQNNQTSMKNHDYILKIVKNHLMLQKQWEEIRQIKREPL